MFLLVAKFSFLISYGNDGATRKYVAEIVKYRINNSRILR